MEIVYDVFWQIFGWLALTFAAWAAGHLLDSIAARTHQKKTFSDSL